VLLTIGTALGQDFIGRELHVHEELGQYELRLQQYVLLPA
jgi:hypothetical protein